MNATEEALNRLSREAQGQVLAALDRYEDGTITLDEFRAVVASFVLAANGQGYVIGYTTTRRAIEELTGLPEVPRVPDHDGKVPHHLDPDRISKALVTIGVAEGARMRLGRLVDGEAKEAAADGTRDVITGSKRVKGWVRSLDSDACELCRWWWREGRVWRPDFTMPRHTGCTCTQTPVVTTTDNYQTTEQARGAGEARARRERSRA